MAKILLLGGTGAMGVYLVPELVNLGHEVFITSRRAKKSGKDKISYIKGNAHDTLFLAKILEDKYDVIVDFMVYGTDEFSQRHEFLLSNTKHYIFLSSCAVFAESNQPVIETSPQLLNVLTDPECLATDAYPLAKARQENILRKSRYKNWTIVRPTITYSMNRFSLVAYEADTFIVRALYNLPVVLSQEIFQKQTTMTWGGDVAKMIARLVLNQNAFCEDYNVCTAEHHSWGEVADYYKTLIGLKIVSADFDTYLKIFGAEKKYDDLNTRIQNRRIMDNSKILKTVGMKQEELMPLFDGLAKELSNKKLLKSIKMNCKINLEIDKITHASIPKHKYFICWAEEKLLSLKNKCKPGRIIKKIKRTLLKGGKK